MVQEALTNARRHAAGRPVDVQVSGSIGFRLHVVVRNPLPAPGTPGTEGSGSAGGTGLIGLRERVELAGGRLDSGLTRGHFQLRVSLPWPR